MVEQAALSRGHTIIAKIGSNQTDSPITNQSISDADVCIDFTHHLAPLKILDHAAAHGKNIIMGTTDGTTKSRGKSIIIKLK